MHEIQFSACMVALTFDGAFTKTGFVIQHWPQHALYADIIFTGDNLIKKWISCPITLHVDEFRIGAVRLIH